MTTESRSLRLLRIDSSAQRATSVTRQLGDRLVSLLGSGAALDVQQRDVSAGLPFVTEEWVAANFTDPAERTAQQREILALSDTLVAELKEADTLVITAPIYNFGIPASLKAWIDLIARARETFRYSENGPVGLLEGKKAWVVVASGGTTVGSEIDFASSYLRHVLNFVGIQDVEIVAADRLMARGEDGVAQAASTLEARVAEVAA
ncbi:MAG: NAD(P)H-dependent oxidoreductase [Acidobacteriota bacterium]